MSQIDQNETPSQNDHQVQQSSNNENGLLNQNEQQKIIQISSLNQKEDPINSHTQRSSRDQLVEETQRKQASSGGSNRAQKKAQPQQFTPQKTLQKSGDNPNIQGLQRLLTGRAAELQMKAMMQKSEEQQKKLEKKNRQQSPLLKLLSRIWFFVEFLIMPIIMLVGTILCIAGMILWQCYRVGLIQNQNSLIALDYITAICFSLEFVYIFFDSELTLIQSVFNLENVVNILVIFDVFWEANGKERNSIIIMIGILRSLKVSKLRYVTKLFFHYMKKLFVSNEDEDLKAEQVVIVDSESELNKFIIESLIKFVSGILIEATILLAIDEISGYSAFNTPSTLVNPLDYLGMSYFVIVSFSTIGYGDIFPILNYSRLTQCLIIVMNLTVMSNFLSKFIEQLSLLSPFNKRYSFSDHVVIIGDATLTQIEQFCDELIQNDMINRIGKIQEGIKVLIVLHEDPSDDYKNLSSIYQDEYDNEVTFLKEDIFDEGQAWMEKANLKEAKILFAFSRISGIEENFERDKQISLAARECKEKFKELPVFLVIQSSFKLQVEQDSMFNGIGIISPCEINQLIMASSMENNGICTVLQHLVTMKAKDIPKVLFENAKDDQFMLSYMKDMQQEIYSVKCPEFFYGMSYKKVSQILYLYGLRVSAQELQQQQFDREAAAFDRKMTIIGVETSHLSEEIRQDTDAGQVEFEGTSNSKSGKKLINDSPSPVKKNSQKSKATQGNSKNKFILLNPQNYRMRQGDVLYVISEDVHDAQETENFTAQDCEEFQNYEKMNNIVQQVMPPIETTNEIINNMFQATFSRYNNINSQHIQDQSYIEPSQHTSIDELPEYDNIFIFSDKIFPKYQFMNHYLIFGSIENFKLVLQLIRKYSDRPACLFSNKQCDSAKWKPINDIYKNISYIQGEYLDFDHLDRAQVKDTYQILIFSELMSDDFPDSVGICLVRIFTDIYQKHNFLIEMREETKISFLNKNAKLKNFTIPPFFWPAFVSGSIHFSSVVMGIMARVVFENNWLKFFKELACPPQLNPDSHPLILSQNRMIHTIEVTQEASAVFKSFGILQNALMNNTPTIVALSMIKHSISSKFREQILDEVLNDNFYEEMEKQFKEIDDINEDFSIQKLFQKQTTICSRASGVKMTHEIEKKKKEEFKQEVQAISSKIIGGKFILTNPSFFTPIEEGDKIVCIGQVKGLEFMKKIEVIDFEDDEGKEIEDEDNLNNQKIQVEQEKPRSKQEIDQEKLNNLKRMASRFTHCKMKYRLKEKLVEQLKLKIDNIKIMQKEFRDVL